MKNLDRAEIKSRQSGYRSIAAKAAIAAIEGFGYSTKTVGGRIVAREGGSGRTVFVGDLDAAIAWLKDESEMR